MSYLIAFIVALVVFLGFDFIWLRTVMKPMFERNVGELLRDETRIGVAAGFYVVYVMGIFYFAILPGLQVGSWRVVLLQALFLGLLAYGTYEATNMATLKGWRVSMMVTDILWGMALTAAAALAGYFTAVAMAA